VGGELEPAYADGVGEEGVGDMVWAGAAGKDRGFGEFVLWRFEWVELIVLVGFGVL
jgi:hypothetical protein